ncbi:MAG: hypothetical protein ACTHWO_08560 [Nesterenkonia sp.]
MTANAVLEYLLETAGLDLESVARRISGDSVLGSRVLINCLKHSMPSIDTPILSVQMPDLVRQALHDALRPQLEMGEIASKALADRAMPDISKAIAGLVDTPALTNSSQQWARDLMALPAFAAAHEAPLTDQERERDGPA